uniref:Uncharacterized protein n=1 Tax=Trichuris muris TaxID=70415 RepID=A0A5S6QIH8_TRIMR
MIAGILFVSSISSVGSNFAADLYELQNLSIILFLFCVAGKTTRLRKALSVLSDKLAKRTISFCSSYHGLPRFYERYKATKSYMSDHVNGAVQNPTAKIQKGEYRVMFTGVWLFCCPMTVTLRSVLMLTNNSS